MPIVHAIVLGITQGLSEFLPISSSGHLLLVPWLFGWHDFAGRGADLEKTFDVALHLGTLVGAVAYFWGDLRAFAVAGVRSIRTRTVENDTTARMAWLLLISAIPGAIVGGLFDSWISDHLGQIWLIATMLIVFGLVLLVADRLEGYRPNAEFSLRDALVMGTAQAVALQPGVSRSGLTITAGRWLRFDRDGAARLSFLMSIPITAGAVVYKGAKLVADGGIPAGFGGAFFWGVVASGLTGFLAIWGTLRYVRTRSFSPFVVYRVAVGVIVFALLLSTFR
ncbi:MAG TPA: undecaprenyl-diphosphate phosphatase [Acidimicrobiales bacterium]|nr:undecaprenyl-diphosphate phosphatase [Acidimicrobiales bacterium]